MLLIVVIVVLLLCCCVTVGVGYWLFSTGSLGEIGRTISGEAPPAATSSDEGQVGQPGTVAAWLSWNEAVDMDLEIWDGSGENFITQGYAYSGDDITSGSQGDEYFEFTSYPGEDFSTGEYVLSAYYSSSNAGDRPDATVTLTVQDIDGNVRTFTKTIKWDPGFDQWHAVRVDAATGGTVLIDEWY